SKLTEWLKQRTTAEAQNRPAPGTTPQPPAPGHPAAAAAPHSTPAPATGGHAPAPVVQGLRAAASAAPSSPPPPVTPGAAPAASPPRCPGGGGARTDTPRPPPRPRPAPPPQPPTPTRAARRPALPPPRRIGMVRELASMARAAEELGPAGAMLSARINKV